jgi:hypothetical protein
MITFPLRVTLFGMRQFAAALAPRGRARRPEVRRPAALTAGGVMRTALDMMRQSAGAFRPFVPDRAGGLGLQEFDNKLACFTAFEEAPVGLRVGAGGATLAGLAAAARALGPYLGLWATEGVGYDHAERALRRAEAPQGLLADAGPGEVDPGSLVSLHAGMGLAFANRLLGAVPAEDRLGGTRRALADFVRLCRDNSRNGLAEAAVEGLGLVTRNLYPHLLPLVDRQLAEIEPDLAGYFWHGVGRALYFAPTNFVPCTCWAWRGLDQAQQTAPHELGRLNAVAGFAWAMTLVNVRHPEILALFLERHGGRLAEGDAFANGVASAALIWHQWAPSTPHLAALCGGESAPRAPAPAERWRALVQAPCAAALRRRYPALRGLGRWGQLFRYRPLAELLGGPD